MTKISVILPARNEAVNLRPLLEKLTAQCPESEQITSLFYQKPESGPKEKDVLP